MDNIKKWKRCRHSYLLVALYIRRKWVTPLYIYEEYWNQVEYYWNHRIIHRMIRHLEVRVCRLLLIGLCHFCRIKRFEFIVVCEYVSEGNIIGSFAHLNCANLDFSFNLDLNWRLSHSYKNWLDSKSLKRLRFVNWDYVIRNDR